MALVNFVIFLISFLVFIALFFSFRRPSNPNFYNHISIVAHRGGFQGVAVENTTSAIKSAIKKKQVDIFEIDLQFTKDYHVVVFHDDHLMRLANIGMHVDELTIEELKKIKLKQGDFHATIETLEEFLQLQDKHRFRTILDVKPCKDNYKLAKEVYKLVRDYNLLDLTCITSFSPLLLLYFRIFDRKLTLSLSVERESASLLARIYYKFLVDFIAHKLALSFLLVQNDLLSLDFIKRKLKQGIQVMPWTINDPVAKKFYERNKIGYLTDIIE